MQRNIDQELRQNQLPKKVTPNLIPANPKEAIGGVTFELKKVNFSGNTLLSSSQIESIIEPYLNKSIDFGQLQLLVSVIETAYRSAGAVARVAIPPQEINNGVIRIQIEESIYGMTRIEGSSTRVPAQQIIKTINNAQTSGLLVNLTGLDRGILLSDDLPGVTVGGILAQGKAALTTDLIVNVADEPLVFGNIQADNTNPTSIGVYRVLGNLGVNSPMGIGDLLSLTYLYGEGSNFSRLGYTLPLGSDGWRIGLNASKMEYRLVSSQFSATGATGTSSSGGVEASYPIIRSRSTNLYIGVNVDYRQFSNSNVNGLSSQYSVMDYSVGLYGNSFDSMGGWGYNNGNFVITRGNTDLAGSPNESLVTGANNAQGGFTKIRYGINRSQLIINGLSLYGSVSGQVSNTNLDSSEMFYLGGAYGVRAYPTNEGAGSQGQLASLELRQALAQNINVTIFYDYGYVKINPKNNFSGASDINSYSMKGAGLSLGWRPVSNVDLKTIWARRLGANPNPSSNGGYQDGTSGSSQFWFTTNVSF